MCVCVCVVGVGVACVCKTDADGQSARAEPGERESGRWGGGRGVPLHYAVSEGNAGAWR